MLNPYATIDWPKAVPHKANLHTHTTRSDGRLSPQEVIDEYRSQGYTILSITDHNMATYPWTEFSRFEPSEFSRNRLEEYVEVFEDRDPHALGMVAIAGNELSDHHHAVSLFSDFETDARDIRQAMREMEDYSEEALAFLAHPFHSWSLKSGSLRIPVQSPLKSLHQGDFALELWFRTEDARRGIIMGNTSEDSPHPGSFNIELLSENRLRWTIRGENGPIILTASLNDYGMVAHNGEWHHLAVTRTGEKLLLYLNGNEVASSADSLGNFDLQGPYVYIGRDARVNDYFYATISAFRHPTVFRGDIDQVRFWGRGFSAESIRALSSGKFDSRENLVLEYNFESLRTVGSIAGKTVNQADIPDSANTVNNPPQAHGTLFSLISDPPSKLKDSGYSRQAIRLGADQPMGWRHLPQTATDKYLELFANFEKLVGVEVHGSAGRRSPLDFNLWDFLLEELMPNRPVWGISNDDMHGLDQLGRNWSVFPMEQASVAKVRRAMINGAYYFASQDFHTGPAGDPARTPVIESIIHDEAKGELIVQASIMGEEIPENSFIWIANGQRIHTGSRLDYRNISGIENYVRLEIHGGGGFVYTNPFGFAYN